MNAKGAGVTNNAKIPNTVFPIPKPSVSYTTGPTSGRKAPNTERVNTMTATADADVSRKASTAYVWHGIKMPPRPNPNGKKARHGTIQWIDGRVVQPYQNSERGTKGAA